MSIADRRIIAFREKGLFPGSVSNSFGPDWTKLKSPFARWALYYTFDLKQVINHE